jgi:hypothetical protein
MANGSLGPIDECAAVAGYENVSRIEIEMIQGIWNASCGEKAKRLCDLLLGGKVAWQSDGRRRFGCCFMSSAMITKNSSVELRVRNF